jgi:hypothetical protein
MSEGKANAYKSGSLASSLTCKHHQAEEDCQGTKLELVGFFFIEKKRFITLARS